MNKFINTFNLIWGGGGNGLILYTLKQNELNGPLTGKNNIIYLHYNCPSESYQLHLSSGSQNLLSSNVTIVNVRRGYSKVGWFCQINNNNKMELAEI